MSCRYQIAFPGTYVHPAGILTITCTLLLSFLVFFSANAQVNISLSRGTPTKLDAVNDIAYGNGVYVAVGGPQNLMRSTDGIHYEVIHGPETYSFYDAFKKVTFANGLFVAVGNSNIETSTDGITWTQRAFPNVNFSPAICTGLIYAGGQWMIAGTAGLSGQRGFILTSPDGITWTDVDVGQSDNYFLFVNVAYINGKYVVGDLVDVPGFGFVPYVLYSSTGASGSWTKVDIDPSVQFGSFTNLQLLNNTLYAFCYDHFYTSTDGIRWTIDTDPRFVGVYITPRGGLYVDGTYYLFVYGATPADPITEELVIYTSPDGLTWTRRPENMTNIQATIIAYANGFYYLLGAGADCVAYSTDASNWTIMDGSYSAVATNGSLYVTVGETIHGQDAIFTSPDWSGTWTNRTLYQVRNLNGVTYGNGKFVAVGREDTASKIGNYATSTDGINWTPGYIDIPNDLQAVAYGNGKYVAVGTNGEIIYSSDGTNWVQAEAEPRGYYDYYAVAYLNNYFVAVGGKWRYHGTTKVKYSADGITWTDVSPSLTAYFDGITYGNGKYVLVGGGNSSDTTTFFSMTTTDITNSSAWSAPSYAVTPFLSTLRGSEGYGGVAYGNGQFVALSNLAAFSETGYVLNSTDGLNWTATSIHYPSQLQGIMYGGSNVFKAVGTGATKLDITAGLPLPLTLLSFTGRQSGDKNILSWQTSDEVNTQEFGIEWSPDGSNFLPIGTVAAAGRSTARLNYSYTQDPAPAGNDFYRLKMVDLDGRFTYSHIVELTVAGDGAPLSVWPNPVRGNILNISAPSAVIRPLTYTLYDATGKAILNGLLTQLLQTVDISGLGKGSYTLRFSNGDVKQVIRL